MQGDGLDHRPLAENGPLSSAAMFCALLGPILHSLEEQLPRRAEATSRRPLPDGLDLDAGWVSTRPRASPLGLLAGFACFEFKHCFVPLP